MTYKTHILTATIIGEMFLLSSDINLINNFYEIFIFIFVLIIASILPDIDEKKSKISQIMPFFITTFFNRLNHRGFTHNIFGFIFLTCLSYPVLYLMFKENVNIAMEAFVIGYLSHIFGDMVTYSGVYFIPGVKTKIPIFNNFLVGSYQEMKVYLLLTWIQIGIVLFYFYLFNFGGM